MTPLQEAARNALEALEHIDTYGQPDGRMPAAIESLRTALARQGEPVAWITRYGNVSMADDFYEWWNSLPCEPSYQEAFAAGQSARPTSAEYAQGFNDACKPAPTQKPVAYITETEQGEMVWTHDMYGEACTYCDDGEFPVPLYKSAQPVAPAPQPAPKPT